jgi:hypothetical protein
MTVAGAGCAQQEHLCISHHVLLCRADDAGSPEAAAQGRIGLHQPYGKQAPFQT